MKCSNVGFHSAFSFFLSFFFLGHGGNNSLPVIFFFFSSLLLCSVCESDHHQRLHGFSEERGDCCNVISDYCFGALWKGDAVSTLPCLLFLSEFFWGGRFGMIVRRLSHPPHPLLSLSLSLSSHQSCGFYPQASLYPKCGTHTTESTAVPKTQSTGM